MLYSQFECWITKVQVCLAKERTWRETEILVSPLVWYVETGRTSAAFIRDLINCKPYLIARRLAKGGSDEEIITRVKEYLGY